MSDELKVALIQSPLVWEDPEQNRAHFTQRIDTITENTNLIVLPEMFNTGFTMSPDMVDPKEGSKTLEWMMETSKKKQMAIVGSVPFRENEKYTNRLFFVKPDGNFYQYDKRHTFTLAGEDKVYKAGEKKVVVMYKGFKICPMICYDLRFPVWSRNTEDYDILIYVANWPKPRINAWDTLLKARAIENMVYCIGVNRVAIDRNGHEYPGHSAVYDCLGNSLVFSKEDTILYACLRREHISTTRNQLNFLGDMDNFTLEP